MRWNVNKVVIVQIKLAKLGEHAQLGWYSAQIVPGKVQQLKMSQLRDFRWNMRKRIVVQVEIDEEGE